MNIKQLRRLVLETIQEEKQYKTKAHRRQLQEGLRRAKLILEGGQEEGTGSSSVSSWNDGTDINGKGADIVNALLNDSDAMYDLICTAAKWAKKGLAGNGITDGGSLLASAKDMFGDDLAKLKTNIDDLTTKLGNAGGFPKKEMPALEWDDAPAIADALNANKGELGVDFADAYKDDEPDFEEWHEKQEINDSRNRNGNLMVERWNKLAGLMTEINNDPRFPYPGDHKVMDGAPDRKDNEGAMDLGSTTGKAASFLTKGKGTGDKINVANDGTATIEEMIPTQSNVKLAKSLLFAFTQKPEKDPTKAAMEAYLASDGKNKYILDGHHRWSGQFVRGNLSQVMNKLVVIEKPSDMDMNTLLTMLTVIGNAMGRPTKGKPKNKKEK